MGIPRQERQSGVLGRASCAFLWEVQRGGEAVVDVRDEEEVRELVEQMTIGQDKARQSGTDLLQTR